MNGNAVHPGIGAVLGLALAVPGAPPQDPDCRLVRVGGYTHSQRFVSRFGPSEYRHHASGGVEYRCADGTLVIADSAVVFESDNQVQLYGNVHFEDSDTRLRADSATYFSGLRQLRAISNVEVTDRASGTVIRGENLVYDQASEFRTLDRILVYGGEPHATFSVARAPPQEASPQQDSSQIGARPPESDSGQVQAEPPEPDSGQASADPPVSGSGQVPPDRMDPDGAQAPAPPAEPPDSTPPVPYEVDAELLRLEGRRYIRAVGQVRIVRDSLQAFGDSLDYDQDGGTMLLLGSARFEGQGYTLAGSTISLTPSASLREEILARDNAHLYGRQVDMRAPAIRLYVDGGTVQRLVALAAIPPLPGDDAEVDTRGLSPGDAERAREIAGAGEEPAESETDPDSLPGPVVAAEDFLLTGDSIEVVSPQQRLEMVVAVGNARAESAGEDSLRARHLPPILRRDWMVGDTIVAAFGSPQPQDSTASAEPPGAGAASRLETLTATGNARSFFKLVSRDTAEVGAEAPPDLHLVDGERITIHLDGQEVVDMDVDGETEGWHLESQRPDSVAVDGAGAAPDTGAVDTTAVDTTTMRPAAAVAKAAGGPARPETGASPDCGAAATTRRARTRPAGGRADGTRRRP